MEDSRVRGEEEIDEKLSVAQLSELVCVWTWVCWVDLGDDASIRRIRELGNSEN